MTRQHAWWIPHDVCQNKKARKLPLITVLRLWNALIQ